MICWLTLVNEQINDLLYNGPWGRYRKHSTCQRTFKLSNKITGELFALSTFILHQYVRDDSYKGDNKNDLKCRVFKCILYVCL